MTQTSIHWEGKQIHDFNWSPTKNLMNSTSKISKKSFFNQTMTDWNLSINTPTHKKTEEDIYFQMSIPLRIMKIWEWFLLIQSIFLISNTGFMLPLVRGSMEDFLFVHNYIKYQCTFIISSKLILWSFSFYKCTTWYLYFTFTQVI